jgi:hypothetical protein
MAKTSSQWSGNLNFPSFRDCLHFVTDFVEIAWFYHHCGLSLAGIIVSCRSLLSLSLYLPLESSAWSGSICSSFTDLKLLHTLIKDLDKSGEGGVPGIGAREGMDIGWSARKNIAQWSISQLVKPLSTLKSLRTLRLCGISSDTYTSPNVAAHHIRLSEIVLVEVK